MKKRGLVKYQTLYKDMILDHWIFVLTVITAELFNLFALASFFVGGKSIAKQQTLHHNRHKEGWHQIQQFHLTTTQ